MKLLYLFLMLFFISCEQSSQDHPLSKDAQVSIEAEQALTRDTSEFALDLYSKLNQKKGNFVVSPYSLSSTAAMLYAGTRGNTQMEIARAFHFTRAYDRVCEVFSFLNKKLELNGAQAGDYHLYIADSIWLQKGKHLQAAYMDLAASATLREVDFAHTAEHSRLMINKWVEKNTGQVIKGFLDEKAVNASTRIILANAVYFKAKWRSPFSSNATVDAPFYLDDERIIQVPTMHQYGTFPFYEEDDFSVVSMPYLCKKGDATGDLSLYIFLPKDVEGLEDFEARLNQRRLVQCLDRLEEKELSLALPKFRIDYKRELNDVLKQMGMKDVFTTRANFSGMVNEPDLFLSAVVHQAMIKIDEEGTEAAAASAAVIALMAMPPQESSVTFNAKHPFLFLLRDNNSGAILFLGRVVKPSLT